MATIEGYVPQEPEKKQEFEYFFSKPVAGDTYVRYRDLIHAICNSDQYPLGWDATANRSNPTPEQKIQNDTLDAVFKAIEACPTYKISADKEPETELEFYSLGAGRFTPGGSSPIRCKLCGHDFGTLLGRGANYCPGCGKKIKDPEKWRSLPQ